MSDLAVDDYVFMDNFTDLQGWKVGIALAQEIYELTKTFPADERYELTKQLRRACKSILLNMAEGFGRYTFPDKANKYTIARGECSEVKAALLIASAVNITTEERVQKGLRLAEEVSKILTGLIQSCRNRS